MGPKCNLVGGNLGTPGVDIGASIKEEAGKLSLAQKCGQVEVGPAPFILDIDIQNAAVNEES